MSSLSRKLPNILIRADASGDIGAGHVMRMIALAQQWIENGGNVILASAQCPDALVKRIESESLSHVSIKAGPGTEVDAHKTIQLAERFNCSWSIVDGYQFDTGYQRTLHSTDIPLAVVDDFRYAKQWCANIIINQNLHAENWTYATEVDNARCLLGSKFVLLRKEFREHHKSWSTKSSNGPLRILITLGGGDSAKISDTVVQLLDSDSFPEVQIRVIVGGACLEQLNQVNSYRNQVEILHDVQDMAQQFLWAEGVISAAGSTCWEWLHLRRTGAIIRMAENQQPVADEFAKRELATDLGWFSDLIDSPTTLIRLKNFLSRVNQQRNQSTLVHEPIVDGLGACRVCQVLSENLSF